MNVCTYVHMYFILFIFLLEISSGQNILFIISDDLSADIDPYISSNHPLYKRTPNISSIGQAYNGYVSIGVCAPSRVSIFTGIIPDKSKNYQFTQQFSEMDSIPKVLRGRGYKTASFGKVYHNYKLKLADAQNIYKDHWDILHYTFDDKCPKNSLFCTIKKTTDSDTTQKAIKFIRDQNRQKNKWFVAVGFRRPHISNAIIKKYILKSVSVNYDTTRIFEMNSIHNYECDKLFSRNFKKEPFLKYYYSAIQMIDNYIGQLLAVINRQNTLIIFTSDHGYSIGHNGLFCKNTNLERIIKVPLFISDASSQNILDASSQKIFNVSLTQLYSYILYNKSIEDQRYTFTQYPRCRKLNEVQDHPCTANVPDLTTIKYMTYSIIDHRTNVQYMEARIFKQQAPLAITKGDGTDWTKGPYERYCKGPFCTIQNQNLYSNLIKNYYNE